MFRILDRYVMREMVVPFAIALVVSTFVLEVPTILKHGEDLLAIGVAWTIVAHALLQLLPSVLSLTIPISLLLGILIGFGRLSADREFVAMQACGVTLMRLLRPVAIVAVLATAATAYETIVALPNANQTFREITSSYIASNIERNVRPGVFFESIPNIVLYVQDVPPDGGWRGVFLADKSTPGRTTVHLAAAGRVHLDHEKQTVEVQLTNDTEHTRYADKPDEHQQSRVAYSVITIDPKWVFPDPPAKGDREMTLAELRTNIEQAKKTGSPDLAFRITYHQKLALPITCPILAIIGLALGASNRRDGKLASFVLGFGVIFAYYTLIFSFQSLAKGGRFSAEWSAWMPNIVMGIVGIVLLAWRTRSADQPIRLSIPAFWRRSRTPPADSLATSSAAAEALPRGRVVVIVRIPHFYVPLPRVLDLYVAREYWRVVVLAFFSLLGIFYISTFIDLADKLFDGRTTMPTLLRYFAYQTPQYVFFVVPMSVLVATLVTIAVMTKNSELIVMRACGISLYRVALPLVLFGALVGGALFFMQERVLPATNRETDRLNRLIRGLPAQVSPLNQRWVVSRSGNFYHYDLLDERTHRFQNLWVYDVDARNWRLTSMTFAADVSLSDKEVRQVSRGDESSGTGDPGLVSWVAHNGWRREFEPSVTYEPFTVRALAMEPPDYFSSTVFDTDQMTYDEMLTYGKLREYVDQRQASGADVMRFRVALQRKIAFPFVTVIMTMLAVPFAAATGRRGALYGIGAGIVLAISYFLAMSVFGALGSGGLLPPAVAAWAPNVLASSVALYLVLTVRT